MSGNPFRKQGQSVQPASSSPPPFQNDDPAPERGSAKVKRVRIETPPPLSPDSPYEDDGIIRRVSNESHEGSPPPSPDSPPPDNVLFPPPLDLHDPFNHSAAAAELFPSHEVIENTRRNSETNVARRDSTGGIVNPFHRTLATIENTEPSESEAVDDEAESATKSGRTHMDVDAFKRMLMTGNPAGASDTTTASLSPSTKPSSNSGSYFPSYNRETSASVNPGQDQSSKRKAGPPPPPPAHRHGKLVEPQRVPQTVAFDSFAPTETSVPSNQLSTPGTNAISSISTPTQTEQSKKKPPAPPLARRGGQSNSNRNSLIRENSSSSIPQQPLASPPLSSPTTVKPPTSKAPPPPPARRGASKPANSLETHPSASTTASQPEEASVPASSSRSSSVASKNRVPAQAPPPPLPPPRGRNSSKSSLDHPSSLTDADGQSASDPKPVGQDPYMRTSDSSAENNPEPGLSNVDASSKPAVSDADILADMDRLQAEVEALRARYSGSKK